MSEFEDREAVTILNQGQKLFGILHLPKKQTSCPAVLICSGFAGSKYGKYRVFVNIAQELSKAGIAVLRFDYRGCGDSEGNFQDVTIDSKVSDTLKCLEFLQKHPSIDPTKIALLGRSLGGVIAVLSAVQFQNIKSLVLWAPVFFSEHWKQLWEASKAQPLNSKELRLPADIPCLEFLQQFFKVNMVNQVKALSHVPLLHIHGQQDQIVKINHAEGYKNSRDSSTITRFIELPHSDHDFSEPNERKIASNETIEWYKETLLK